MTEKNKFVPTRMCCCCRTHHQKNEMVRVVKNKDGNFSVDQIGKSEGRGAYFCLEKNCFEKMIKTHALNKSFKCNVPNEIYEKIKEI